LKVVAKQFLGVVLFLSDIVAKNTLDNDLKYQFLN